jgi:hypothetical protein
MNRSTGNDAILFSGNRNYVNDAKNHLDDHKELYWEVGFDLAKDTRENFSYPIDGYIHVNGAQVEYRVKISNIIPFATSHYENEALAAQVKPESWLREWKENSDVRLHEWKYAFVITEIVPFSYDTLLFKKIDGTSVRRPPKSYVRVLPPEPAPEVLSQPA